MDEKVTMKQVSLAKQVDLYWMLSFLALSVFFLCKFISCTLNYDKSALYGNLEGGTFFGRVWRQLYWDKFVHQTMENRSFTLDADSDLHWYPNKFWDHRAGDAIQAT